jgi:hypothetical protein
VNNFHLIKTNIASVRSIPQAFLPKLLIILPNAIKFTHLTFQQLRLVSDGLVSENAQLPEVLGFRGNALLDHVLMQELGDLLLSEGLFGLED